MQKSRFYTAQLFYLLIFTQFVGLMQQAGMTKYIVFALFLLPFLFFGREKIRLRSAYILMPSLVYITLGLVSSAASGFFDFYSFKMGLLLMFPAVFSLVLYEKGDFEGMDICRTVFLSYVLYTIFFSYTYHIAESTRAFVFGMFAVYFLIKRQWVFCALAVFVCYYSDKRIALMGMFAVFCFAAAAYLLLKLWRTVSSRKLWIAFGLFCTAAAYVVTFMVHSGALIALFEKVHIDPWGRQTIWGAFRQFADMNVGFTGHGLGFIMSKMDELRVWMVDDRWFQNLHCDFYRGYIELGFFGLGIWMLSYFRSYYKLTQDTEKNNTILIFAFSAIAYTFVIFITDNILTYFEYWVPLNLMLLDMAYSRPSDVKRQALRMKAHYLCD